MEVDDSKYVVFKRVDVEPYLVVSGSKLLQKVLDDAVVIREQDVFAPPALDAYANVILAFVEAVESVDTVPMEETKRLREIADYFHERAVSAWDRDRKLPD